MTNDENVLMKYSFYVNNNRNDLILLYNDSSKNLRHVSTLVLRVIDIIINIYHQYYHHKDGYYAYLNL